MSVGRPKSKLRKELEDFYNSDKKTITYNYTSRQQKNQILTLMYSMKRRKALDFDKIVIDKKIDIRGTDEKVGTITMVKKENK